MKLTLSLLLPKTMFFFGLALLISCAAGGSETQQQNVQADITEKNITETPKVVEVMYLHGKSRCATCIAIEKAAQEAVKVHFSKELENGSLVFLIADVEQAENRYLAEKYQAFGATLLVCSTSGDEEIVKNLTADGFRFAMRDKAKFTSLLRHAIEESLKQ